MIRIPFHNLNNFTRLIEKMSPQVDSMMQLHPDQREAEIQQILAEFNVLVDDKKEWCTWENDQDYTVFALRWA